MYFQLEFLHSFLLQSYLETDGGNATTKPWLWIVLFLVGALLKSVLEHWYLYLETVVLVRIQGLLTQLVFEHSLRIRMKAEVSGHKPSSQASTPSTPSIAEESSPTADNASEYGHPVRDENETQTSSSPTMMASSREASQSTLTGSIKGKGRGDSEDAHTPKKHTRDAKNLMGRINNLVSSDLDAIVDGVDFLTVGMTIFRNLIHDDRVFTVYTTVLFVPLQIILSVIFLSNVLGWRYDKNIPIIY